MLAGETTGTAGEKEELLELVRTEKLQTKCLRDALGNCQAPLSAVLEAGKQYFATRSATDIFRHSLIRRTIRMAQKPAVIEYGTIHSLLYGELKKDGIPVSREMPSQVFSPSAVVHRTLLIGKKPSDLDYKRGITDLMLRPLAGRDNDKSSREEALARSTLIRSLSENQLDEILRTRNEQLVLTLNGLPANAKFGQVKQFIKGHSAFWRRERIIRRKRNKAKKQKWANGQ
jgi:hypothetical protein